MAESRVFATRAARGDRVDLQASDRVDLQGLGRPLATPLPSGEVTFFQAMVEAVPVAIYATDASGHITFYNNAAADLWGVRPELGKSEFCGSWKLYWPDGTPLPHDQCPMALALKEKRPIRGVEAVAERPDGTRVPFMPYPTPIFGPSGVMIGAVNLLVDLTDRKDAEEFANRLASIVQSSDDAIISKDLNGVVMTWNRGAERIFGYSADEIIGQPVSVLIPEDRLDEEPGILDRIRRGERVDHYETARRCKDGTLIDISLTISPVRNGEGRIIGASKVARDISDRRRAEESKELLLRELKHRIKNSLATVQALATQTLLGATSEERASFIARLQALSGAHELLTSKAWDRAHVVDIVRRALRLFQESYSGRIVIEGDEAVSIDANKSLMLTMALHELATNAVKYGALSNDSGWVRIGWDRLSEDKLRFAWRERGGPAVTTPKAKGFGSRLIERALAGEHGGAKFEYAAEGFTCTIEIPLLLGSGEDEPVKRIG